MGSQLSKKHVKAIKYINMEDTKHNMALVAKSCCHQHQTLITEDLTYGNIENEIDIILKIRVTMCWNNFPRT